MRETVAAYCAADKSAVRAAKQLGVHRTTVRQLLDRFEGLVGVRGVNTWQVTLALRIYDDFLFLIRARFSPWWRTPRGLMRWATLPSP